MESKRKTHNCFSWRYINNIRNFSKTCFRWRVQNTLEKITKIHPNIIEMVHKNMKY